MKLAKILNYVFKRPDIIVGTACLALAPISWQINLISAIPGGRNACLIIGSVSASYITSVIVHKLIVENLEKDSFSMDSSKINTSTALPPNPEVKSDPSGLGSGLPTRTKVGKKKKTTKNSDTEVISNSSEELHKSEALPLTGGAAILARVSEKQQEICKSSQIPDPQFTNVEAVPLTGSAALLARMKKQQPATPPTVAPPAGAPLTGSAALLAQMRQKKTEPIVLPKSDGGVPLWVLFGGEAATQVAKDLAAEMQSHGYLPKLLNLDQFKEATLESTPACAVFVVETVENAQPAESAGAAVRYFNRKRKGQEQGLLKDKLKFCVVCVGDTNLLLDRQTTTAQDCNQAGQTLDTALLYLGGERMCIRCEANDATGLEEAVEPWKAKHFWPGLAKALKGQEEEGPSTTAPSTAITTEAEDAQHQRPLLILFGSQTGNSQEIAKQIHAECPEKGIKATVMAMQELKFQSALPTGTVVLFVVSSTGDGDPPDNCALFYSQLKKKSNPDGMLRGVDYTVLGLGDQNYTAFMEVPRILHKRMEALGATCFYPRGEADEVEGLDEFVEVWSAGLWEPLLKVLCAKGGSGEAPGAGSLTFAEPEVQTLKGVPALEAARVEVKWLPVGTPVPAVEYPHTNGGDDHMYSAQAPFLAGVNECRLLTAPSSDRRVLHLGLDIRDSGAVYQPGDSIAVLPQNPEAEVQALLARLGLSPLAPLDVVPAAGQPAGTSRALLLPHLPLPGVTLTPERCLKHHCDIASPPRKTMLRTLAEYTKDEGEKHRLLQLSSRGGKEMYDQQIKQARPSLLQLLNMFPSCCPPFADLLDALPALAPRYYSLTSCQKEHPSSVQVAFSVVNFTSPTGLPRAGVATNWLDNLAGLRKGGFKPDFESAAKVPIFFKKGGGFHPPADILDATMIMVGPGTGVAPFRGFLQARRAALKEQKGKATGQAWLYFGCRQPEEDFLYREEFQEMVTDGTLTHLKTAFSRVTEEKVYVQHLMLEQGAELCRLIMAGAYVFVCGDGGQMAKDVNHALITILETHSGMKDIDVSSFIRTMIQDHKYVRDIWS